MSFSRRAILRNWALTVPRCAVLCGRAPLWHPLTEGSQSFLAPLCLTEFLCLKHLQCLLVFSQFSSRLGDESPTGSWPEDKPKSPKECSIQDHAFFWRLRLLYKASLTVWTPVPLGSLVFLLLSRLPAALATWESGVSIALIIFISVGPHLLRAKGTISHLLLAIALASGIRDYVPFASEGAEDPRNKFPGTLLLGSSGAWAWTHISLILDAGLLTSYLPCRLLWSLKSQEAFVELYLLYAHRTHAQHCQHSGTLPLVKFQILAILVILSQRNCPERVQPSYRMKHLYQLGLLAVSNRN